MMDEKEFVKEWEKFHNALGCSPADAQARVTLFGIWYKEAAEQRRMDSMGLGGMMGAVQNMLKGTTDQIDRASKSEDWRGEEH